MMKLLSTTALALATFALAFSAQAADPKKMAGNKRLMDFSNTRLISNDAAVKLMDENIPEKVWKITKGSQYVWVSQVEGGLNGNTCIITARVMVLPLTVTLNVPLFRPRETATAFDAQPNSGTEACQALARTKLKEATLAVVSSVVKS